MRTLLPILTIILLPVLASAQTANFFKDGSRWVYWTWENSEPGQQLVHNATEQNIIHGDTLIGGLSYYKLYTTLHKELNVNTFPPLVIHSYDSTGPSFLRYDTMLKKVYYLPGIDSTERLIYDFNLQVGDTTPMQSKDFPVTVIDSIDTITLFGIHAKRFFVNIGPGFEWGNYIIEGMGGSNGLFYFQPEYGSLSGGSYHTRLTCFQYDESIFSDQGDCPFIDFVSVRPVDKQLSVTIGPNPSQDVFTLTIDPVLFNARFIITDARGRLVQSFILTEIYTEGRIQLPGIYFWSVEQHVRLIASGKLIIQ